MRKLFLLVLLLAGSVLVVAGYKNGWFRKGVVKEPLPAAKEEYQKIYRQYNQKDTVWQIAGKISLSDGEQPGIVKETMPFRYQKENSSFLSQWGFLKTFYDGEFLIQVDTLHEYIAVSGAAGIAGKANYSYAQPSFDMLFSDTAAFKVTGTVSESNGERMLTIISDFNPEIKTCCIYYDPASYRIKRMEIIWWKDGVQEEAGEKQQHEVWITKIDYQYLPAGGLTVRQQMDALGKIEHRQLEPAEQYKGYRLQSAF